MVSRTRTPPLLAAMSLGGLAVWIGWRVLSPTPEPQALHVTETVAGPAAPRPVTQVALIEVSAMADAERLRLGGTVEPSRQVHLAAQAPGRVAYVAGEEGTVVAEGAVVVALDDGGLTARYNAALVELANQIQGLQNARVQLWQNLYGPTQAPMGGAPQSAFEQFSVPAFNMMRGFFPFASGGPLQTTAQSQRNWATASAAQYDYQRQAAAVATAQSQVQELAAEHRDRSALAPFAGTMLKRFVREGDVVQPGQPLADLADMTNLAIRVEVPVGLMADMKLGDVIPVTIEGNNTWAPVAQIFPAATEGAHTVTVKLALNPGAPAAPGMYALAWIAQPGGGSPAPAAPAIPTADITWRGSLPVAFVATADGRAEMRVLRLGDRQADRTAVLSGLEIGEKVVADPAPTLKSGDPIQVAP